MTEQGKEAAPTQAPVPVDANWLGEWLKSMRRYQADQLQALKSIRSWITFLGVLVILGLLVNGCSALMHLGTATP